MADDKEIPEEVEEIATRALAAEERAESRYAAPEEEPKPVKQGRGRFGSGLIAVLRALNPKNIFSGRMVSIDFILHRWKTLLVIFFVLMFYISNRYSCQQKIAEIGELRKEVEEIGYKSLNMFSRLKNLQREETVLKMVQENGINLVYPETPPYVIIYKENGAE